MSWNLWWRFGAGWRRRQPAIISTLEAVRPDVVGLQEVWATGGGTEPTTTRSAAAARPQRPMQ